VQHPEPEVVQQYLDYAETPEYDLSDLIKIKQPQNNLPNL
jgi:hypothetical protein